MAPRGGAIWPSAGAETYGGVHPWRDLTGTRSPPYGSGGGCEGGVGSSGFGIRDSGIGNRESGIGNRQASTAPSPLCAVFGSVGAGKIFSIQPSRRTSLTPGNASSLPSRPDSWS
ncbi:hypothetical protein DGM85_06690 [Xanthomonas phaseoli pv. phaseoli]|nr:hypothetical protein DGM85_06690 [Xanthomonas phaseoli pv. phaseoli]